MSRVYNFTCLVLVFLFSLCACEPSDSPPDNEGAVSNCGELGDCPSSSMDCHSVCGCDRLAAYYYNETTGNCVLSYKHLMMNVLKTYGVHGESLDYEEGMSKKIRMEAEKIFQAILVSVILFISCSAICVISACFYCCRMNYCDYKLKSDIKALKKKLQRNQTIKKPAKQHLAPIAESCNIVCEDAGVFVV